MKTYAYKQRKKNESPDLTAWKREMSGLRVREGNRFVDDSGETAAFEEMAAKLQAGDLVVVDTLTSLGANNLEIAARWQELRGKRHVNLRVLDEEYLDTRLKGRDVSNEYIADLAMSVFVKVSKDTHKIRKEKQAEGIARAKKAGVQFGTGRKPLPPEFEKYKEMYLRGEITGREASEKLGIAASTFFYRVKH